MSKEKQLRAPGADLFEWLQMLLVCILGAVIVFNCVARLSVVDGHSMDPTLSHGELMLVWGLGYTPKPGDIVVVNKTVSEFPEEGAIVKRVVAVGGQTVELDYENSRVCVDGQPLEEDYILEDMDHPRDPYMQQTSFVVPEGEYFLLGDNRNGSNDSRDERIGTVHGDYFLGKAVAAIWPVSKIGLIG